MANQYTDPLTALTNKHNDILDSCETTASGCLVPIVSEGIYQSIAGQANSSLRCNYSGKKVICHRLVWLYHNGNMPYGEVSHLCGTSNCCNIDHMVEESRHANMSRIGCHGTLTDGEYAVCACLHQPRCIKTTRVLRLEITRIQTDDT